MVLADAVEAAWTHDHPIILREAQELGLPAHGDMPTEFYQLMALFPQPTQRQPAVQYIPTPYGPPINARRKEQIGGLCAMQGRRP